jgi:hypothetical protein
LLVVSKARRDEFDEVQNLIVQKAAGNWNFPNQYSYAILIDIYLIVI